MQSLGKYQGLTRVGQGASATVYRGVHRQLKAVRALKVFDQDLPGRDRRVKEAVYQSRVDHPGIVQVMDLDRDSESGLFYLVMEFAPLGSLRSRLEAGPLEPGLAMGLGAQMARALARAHGQGVWHLDLKPDNILFFGPKRVKIADFGLARTSADPLDPAWVVGTPNYMAPEQLDGRPGAASDLWALGAMLLEMLIGRPCFPGESLTEVQAAMAAGPVRVAQRLAEAGVDLPLAQQDLIQAMLSEDPAKRPASAEDAARVLAGGEEPSQENLARGPATLRISAACARCGVRVPLGAEFCPDCAETTEQPPDSVPDPLPLEAPSVLTTEAPRARNRLLGLAAGLLLAVAAGLALWAQGPDEGNPPGPAAQAPLLPVELPDWGQEGGAATARPEPAGPEPLAVKTNTAPPQETASARTAPRPKVSAAPPARVRPKSPSAAPSKVSGKKPTALGVTSRGPQPAPHAKAKAAPAPARRAASKPATRAATPVHSKPPLPAMETARPKAMEAKAAARPAAGRPPEPAGDSAAAPRAYTEPELTKLLAKNPGHLGARRNLALLYWQKGRHLEAVSQLQFILRARPHDQEARHALEMILAQARGK